MKNYLFAPFKNDDEKKEEFKHVKDYLPNGHHHNLIIFIGRLESYYDNIITELNKRIEICKDNHERYDIKAIDENTELKAENKELKAENDKLTKHVDKYGGIAYDELKAELEKVKRCNKTMDGIIIERDAEIKRLNDDYNVANDGIDDLNDVVKDLRKENEELKAELNKAKCGGIN